MCLVFAGPLGEQQLISVGGGFISGGVAAAAGPGEVRTGPAAQRLGRPGVPQVLPVDPEEEEESPLPL